MNELQFCEQYSKHKKAVLLFVQGMMRGDRLQIAEDLASETWLHAWRNREQWRGDCSFRTWLCSIAVNVVRSYWRSKKSPLRGGDVVMVPIVSVFNVKDPATGPPSKTTDRLHAAREINRLEPEEIQLLTLKYIYGVSNQDIAVKMSETEKITTKAVKTRMFRIRERARQKFTKTQRFRGRT